MAEETGKDGKGIFERRKCARIPLKSIFPLKTRIQINLKRRLLPELCFAETRRLRNT